MTLVLDASVALSWCFEDEATESTLDILRYIERTEAIAPAIWPVEIAHVLRQASRRGRIARRKVTDLLEAMATLPVRLVEIATTTVFVDVMDVAWARDLTPYDALYVELALRTGSELATLDRAMARAGRDAGIAILPDRV
jgi:predicted nucleic acid-binding protein